MESDAGTIVVAGLPATHKNSNHMKTVLVASSILKGKSCAGSKRNDKRQRRVLRSADDEVVTLAGYFAPASRCDSSKASCRLSQHVLDSKLRSVIYVSGGWWWFMRCACFENRAEDGRTAPSLYALCRKPLADFTADCAATKK